MNCESVIYLDADFLSKKFEDLENKPVMTSLVRDEGLKAGIKFLFASGGAHTKEVKTYECSVYGMLKNIIDNLGEYPVLDSIDESVHNKTAWIEGRLFIGHLSVNRQTATSAGAKGEILEEGKAFEIEVNNNGMVTLVTKDQYFSSGYENLLNTISPVHLSFESQVRCLLKIVGWNKVINMAVGVPYVIIDKS